MAHPAVFLDRDGTLNVESHYLHRREDFEWIPGAIGALGDLKAAGFRLVVVTNQSGIARGYYAEARMRELHRWMNRELEGRGAGVDGFYHCPHHPSVTPGGCTCRKPSPELLLRAARELDLDLSRSWMVGDKLIDVQAGLNAGCRAILVRTGYGAKDASGVPAGVPVADDVGRAAELIIAEGRNA